MNRKHLFALGGVVSIAIAVVGSVLSAQSLGAVVVSKPTNSTTVILAKAGGTGAKEGELGKDHTYKEGGLGKNHTYKEGELGTLLEKGKRGMLFEKGDRGTLFFNE